MFNIIIFTSDSIYSYLLLKNFLENNYHRIESIYISESLKKQNKKKFILNKLFNGLGFRYYLFRLAHKIKYKAGGKNLKQLSKDLNVPIKYVSNINDNSVIKELQEKKPTLIVSAFFDQIIKKEILELPSFGILNVHPSFLPNYRGVKPAFWALKNNEEKTGITVHMMDEGIDTGDIFAQKEIGISPDDTFNSLMKKLSSEGSFLLNDVVYLIENGSYSLVKQNNEGFYFGQPDKEDLKLFLKYDKHFY